MSYAPVTTPKGRRKVSRVLSEHKRGELRSSSGEQVVSRDQAIAIAMSEGRQAEGKRRASRVLRKNREAKEPAREGRLPLISV